MHQDHGYKLLFAQPRMVIDLLRGFVPESWVGRLDFATLERVNPTYVADDLRHREDDMVWRLRWGDGECLYVYLILEFQSTVDRHMAIRVLAYVALLYQDLIRRGELCPSGKLPPILPLVIYNGRQRWWAPTSTEDLIEEIPGGLADYRPRLRYLLIHERDHTRTELASMANATADLFGLEQASDPGEVQAVLTELARRLRGPEHLELRRAFVSWLRRVLLPSRWPGLAVPGLAELEDFQTMLAETVLEWTEQWKQEGLQKGLRLGEARMLIRQLEQRFGPLASDARARIEAADADLLLQWGERLLGAESLHEVFRP